MSFKKLTMKGIQTGITTIIAMVMLASCSQQKSDDKDKQQNALPIIGKKRIVTKQVDGESVKDTVQHRVPEFQFIDQDSAVVTHNTFDGSIYVADFFFTSCPTICPEMTENMHKVYKSFADNERVKFLSHSVDPERDTPAALKNYAQKLGVKSSKWKFVTGRMDSIYKIGKQGYMASMEEDEDAPGGFLHSGQFFLVDDQRRIRGIYRGTKEKSVKKLIEDIQILLKQDKDGSS